MFEDEKRREKLSNLGNPLEALEELSQQMDIDIALLAEKRGKTKEETLRDFTDYYDGYHFTWPSPDVFNPFSLLNAFNDGMIKAYWFGSGTPTGRVDTVMRTRDTLYLIELKLNRSAEAAMDQINLKDYAARFALCGLPIVKVGINFDSGKRTIGDWRIEKEG